MNQTEFRMITDLEASVPKTLDANFEEVKAWLTESLEDYKNLAVTEDTLSDCKAARAKINKLSKAIDSQRIAVKKRYLEPYSVFEAKAKELTAICDSVAHVIDTQVKEIEEARKQEKLATLRQYFDEHSAECEDYLSWDVILNPKWSNATYAVETAMSDIDGEISKCKYDIATIRDMESPYQVTLLSVYRMTRDMGAVIRKEAELRKLSEIEERRKIEAEAARIAAEKRKAEQEAQEAQISGEPGERDEEVQNHTEVTPQADEVVRETETEEKQYDFRVWATNEQIRALADFLKSNGIKYGKVK